jgi:hypothetical protein
VVVVVVFYGMKRVHDILADLQVPYDVDSDRKEAEELAYVAIRTQQLLSFIRDVLATQEEYEESEGEWLTRTRKDIVRWWLHKSGWGKADTGLRIDRPQLRELAWLANASVGVLNHVENTSEGDGEHDPNISTTTTTTTNTATITNTNTHNNNKMTVQVLYTHMRADKFWTSPIREVSVARQLLTKLDLRLLSVASHYFFWQHTFFSLTFGGQAQASPISMDDCKEFKTWMHKLILQPITDELDVSIRDAVRAQFCPIGAIDLFTRYRPFDEAVASNRQLVTFLYSNDTELQKLIQDQGDMDPRSELGKMHVFTLDTWIMMIWGNKLLQAFSVETENPWHDWYCVMWKDWGNVKVMTELQKQERMYRPCLPRCLQISDKLWIVDDGKGLYECQGAVHAIATWLFLAQPYTEWGERIYRPRCFQRCRAVEDARGRRDAQQQQQAGDDPQEVEEEKEEEARQE